MKLNSEIILEEFYNFINISTKLNEPHLASFSFPLEMTDALLLADKLDKFCNDIFLFRVPENKLTITGLNSALELTPGNGNQFTSADDNISTWKKNFVKNWNEINFGSVPIICCTARFDALKSSPLWNDFESLRIYIPELIVYTRNGLIKGFYNFIMDGIKSAEEISDRFKGYLNKLETLSIENVENYETKTESFLIAGKQEFLEWEESFNKALAILQKGEIEKLVLSRTYSFTINNPVSWAFLLNKLFHRFNDCYLFFLKRNSSFFFGSSPEMFLKVSDSYAEVESVAGSAPRGERSDTDYQLEKVLQTSEKNHQEHLFVSEFISDILIHYSNNVRIIEEKQIRKLDNIQHLITRISAELSSKENLFELIDSLFPTPAVCGVPKESAMSLIRKLESHDRGLYSGLVGILDFEGNCELAVSIRSALVKNNTVTAFAGAGLVNTSNLDDEFHETNLKLNTILSLFSNENKSK